VDSISETIENSSWENLFKALGLNVPDWAKSDESEDQEEELDTFLNGCNNE
jgi:hypothetical protein